MLSKLGWELEVGKYLLPAALSASVSLLPQLENPYLLKQWKTFQTAMPLFFFFLLLLPLLVLFFSNQCSFAKAFQLVRAALQNFQLCSPCPLLSGFSAVFLLYLLPNNLSAQKYQVQFFCPCHQTIPLSCPLLPAVIAATHLLNPQASFHFQSNVPSGSFLEHLPWFCECFPVYIFHGGF